MLSLLVGYMLGAHAYLPRRAIRDLACRFTEERRYFVSESSVYRILKAADLITSSAYVLMSAADAFQHPTTRVHEMWQTDFDQAWAITGIDRVQVRHRPRPLSDNGPAYVSGELGQYLEERQMTHTRGAPYHPQTQGKIERYHFSSPKNFDDVHSDLHEIVEDAALEFDELHRAAEMA